MRIELTLAILSPRLTFSETFDRPFFHVFLFGKMFPESHSFVATVSLHKHVTKYKNMRKWMVEFLGKSERRGDKIARGNSIRVTESFNLL